MRRWAGCGSAPVWASWRREQTKQAGSISYLRQRPTTEISPVRWSEVGLTPHLLKNASVSGSTTSRRVTFPPTLMAATTSECVFPSTDMPFTCKEKQGDFWTRMEITKNIALFMFCFPPAELRIYFTILSLCLRPEAAGQEILWILDTHTQTHAHSPASNIPTNLRSLPLT